MPDATTLVFIYVTLSLLVGGAAVTYEIWHQSVRLDRADGRGKFPSPKMQIGELIFFGLFVIIFWPILLIPMILDAIGATR